MSLDRVISAVDPCFSAAAWTFQGNSTEVSGSGGRLDPTAINGAWIGELVRARVCARVFRRLQGYLSEQLQSASSADELDLLMEDVVLDSRYGQFQRQLESMVSFDAVRRLMAAGLPTPAYLVALSGVQFSGLLDEGMSYDHEILAATLRLLGARVDPPARSAVRAAISSMGSSVAAEPRKDGGFAALLTPHLPPEMKRSMLAMQMGSVAQHALRGCGPQSLRWFVGRLFETWVSGAKECLRFLAAVPGSMVPVSIIPDTQRLDLSAMMLDHAQAEAGYQQRLAAARASGATVYPLSTAPLDD